MAAPSFAKDIRPLFTAEDISHMSFKFDLSSFDDVKRTAPAFSIASAGLRAVPGLCRRRRGRRGRLRG